MSSVSLIGLAIRQDQNENREYIPVDTIQFKKVNAISLKGISIPGGEMPSVSDVISLKYKEKGVAQLNATTGTNFSSITDGLNATDPAILPYCFAITISGLPLNDDMQPLNGTFYILAAYSLGADFVLELSIPSITTEYFDILDPDVLDAATFTMVQADYYQIFEQKNSDDSSLNGLCNGQYVEAYLPERYLTLDPDVQAVAFAGSNMILYSDTQRFTTEDAALVGVEAKWDAVEEQTYLLTNLLDTAGQDQFNLIKVGDRLRVELTVAVPPVDVRHAITGTVTKTELTDVSGNKYGKLWIDNPSITDATYDYDKVAAVAPDEFEQIAELYVSKPQTLLFVDGSLTSRVHDSDVIVDTNENLIIPGQYYDLSFINSETFNIGSTETPSELISSKGGVVDAATTAKPSGGGFAIDMFYGDITDMMLEAAMGGRWMDKLLTNDVQPIAGSDIIEVTDLAVGEQLRVGYPIRLSGSVQYRTVNQSKEYVNNGVFIITDIKTYGPAYYRFRVAKSMDTPLSASELFLEEPANDDYALQCSVCENGLRSIGFKVEKIEYANTPFVTLFSGQKIQALNVTLGEQAIIKLDLTFDGSGYKGVGRTFPYKGKVIDFLGSDVKIISAASPNNVFMRNGVKTIPTAFTWSASGLTDILNGLGTPFAQHVGRNPLTTDTKYTLEFDSVTSKQRYLQGCLEQDLLYTMGNSPECESLQEEEAYTYYSRLNKPSNLTTATKAKTGQLLLDFQAGFDKIRRVGDDYYGYRDLVCSWSRFDKVI